MIVPKFGVGTFRLSGQTVIDSVKNALSAGYRAIDTAQIYGNEAEVGQAIAESPVPILDKVCFCSSLSKESSRLVYIYAPVAETFGR